MHLTKIALVLEYDGTRFHGFQLQPNGPTVQGEMEQAVARFTGERVRVMCASRTDAGVHAAGQVASFRAAAAYPAATYVGALNHFLPEDVSVLGAYEIGAGFSVQTAARQREYEYLVLNRTTPSPLLRHRAHVVPQLLDAAAMEEAAVALVGEHDFASFAGPLTPRTADTRKRIDDFLVARTGDVVALRVAGNAFLHQQVRRMAGCLVQVGLDRMSAKDVQGLLDRPRRGTAQPTLPARGLCLQAIRYEGFPPAEAQAAA